MGPSGPKFAGRSKQSQSIRLGFLQLLALLLTLTLASSSVLIWSTYAVARDLAKRQMQDTARALSRVVDGEFARNESLLRALAVSPSIKTHDWPAIDRAARRLLPDANAWIVIGDRAGQQLVNTRLPVGARLPAHPLLQSVRQELDRGETHICDLIRTVKGRHVFCVDVPLKEDGKARYFMSVVMAPRGMAAILKRQRVPADWYASIVDSRGQLVWWSREAERYVGAQMNPQVAAAMHAADEGVLTTRSLDGVQTYAAYSRSPTNGWAFFVAAPRKLLDAGVWPALIGSLLIVSLLMVIGAIAALRWTRQVARGVEGLAAQAGALGRRESFTPSTSSILELEDISAALSAADRTLRRRDAELAQLNASLTQRVDITIAEREAALAQLHEAQKLETLGQLTGGVAHDFNNLLTPIMGSLDILHRRVGEDSKGIRLIEAALGSAERAKVLVARLLSFARRQTLVPRAVEVSALVSGMADFIRHSLGSAVRIHIDAAAGPAVAHVDPNQLELAILNLAINARDAMPGGGDLKISVTSDQLDEQDRVSAGRYIHIAIADTGHGMDQATLERAIEPFFTTKDHGRGTGLGLSMVHGLAAQSGGIFRISSILGQGTSADLWLPPSDQPVADMSSSQGPPAARGHGIVLVVDDEPLVRAATVDMLVELGYEVHQARSGLEAVEMIRSGPAFDAMVTDYLMPEMNGAALIMAVRAIRPTLPIVLVTGYSAPELELPAAINRLAKPFRQNQLAASIAMAMAQKTDDMPTAGG
jgi:signal transduction histidine kinase/CheY-like chemotaxis protein